MIPGIGQMGFRKGGVSLKTNLISHFSQEETSGSIAYDSHSGNNGTIYNCTLNQTGKVGQCYSYNGSNSRILIPDNSIYDNDGNISINVWLRFSSTSSQRVAFGNGSYTRLQLNLGSFNIQFHSSYESWPPTTMAILSPSLNTWYMITAVFEKIFDGSHKQRCKGYVNGTLANTADRVQTDGNWNMNPGGRLSIGASDNSYFFSGLIDELSWFNKSLTEAEITKLYNSGNGLPFANW